MIDLCRFALAARIFTIAALCTVVLVEEGFHPSSVFLIIPVAAVAQLLTIRLPTLPLVLVEGVVILGVTSLPPGSMELTALPYLVVPVIIASLAAGRVGLLTSVTTFAIVGAAVWIWKDFPATTSATATSATWLLTALGLGLFGMRMSRSSLDSSNAGYRSAIQLIRRLGALSGRLNQGLDAVGLADGVLADIETRDAVRGASIWVDGPQGLSVLRSTAELDNDFMQWAEPFVTEAHLSGKQQLAGRRAGLPILADGESIGVCVLEFLHLPSESSIKRVEQALDEAAMRLHAALLFGQIQHRATNEERLRLAREVHDGVAQDVASLGYAVDAAINGTPEGAQRDLLDSLRGEISRVVSELRHSVFDLRHEIAKGESLGAGLDSFARHLGATSDLKVHVSLDESGPRLATSTEIQLLRIGQEAMTNARKHALATNLWIECHVDAPRARIEIRDDGNGEHQPKTDSQGLSIMLERAQSIGAHVEVTAPLTRSGGTRVLVQL